MKEFIEKLKERYHEIDEKDGYYYTGCTAKAIVGRVGFTVWQKRSTELGIMTFQHRYTEDENIPIFGFTDEKIGLSTPPLVKSGFPAPTYLKD